MAVTMTAEQFTDPVAARVDAAVTKFKGRHYSDIIDDAGNQYVDLVMGGGGILGVALVGYTYVLERVGLRFLRIGGTSAGAINALALAGLGTGVDDEKSTKLIGHLANLDVWSLVDGQPAAKSLVEDFLHQHNVLRKGFDVAREYNHFAQHLGLNPGNQFQEWLSSVLKSANISTNRELHERMEQLPAGLRTRAGKLLTQEEADPYVAVIATDISTETRAVFPKMAELYWADPDAVDPALFVRASMSIPFFFEPFRVSDVPQDAAAQARWTRLVGNTRFPPPECAFVDGGVLSNFPIDLFHDPTVVPDAPTFGVKLGATDPPIQKFDRPVQLTLAVFNSARHSLDTAFLNHNPDFSQLVCTVNTGTQSWLNFDVTAEEKIELFEAGVTAAIEFLEGFDWPQYKKIRADLVRAHQTAGTPTGGGTSTSGPTAPPSPDNK